MAVPKAVQDYVDDQDDGGEIDELDPNDLLFNGFICVSGHELDLNEANIEVHTINLTKVSDVNLMKGPNCVFYEKTDKSQPSYVIGSWDAGDGQEHWWAEF